jgi:putative NADH-flavin reductase
MAGKGVVALTGATGFVGGATLNQLVESGWQVRALTRRSQPVKAGITWVEGALDQPESLMELCDGADAILHIAGVVNAPDAAGFEAGNVTGTAHLVGAAKQSGISRFVHVSSLSAREPQLSVYGASKAKGEKLVATSMLDWTIIRPPGVYGPGDTEVLEMFKMAAKGFCLLSPLQAEDRGSMSTTSRVCWSRCFPPMTMRRRKSLRRMMVNRAGGSIAALRVRLAWRLVGGSRQYPRHARCSLPQRGATGWCVVRKPS